MLKHYTVIFVALAILAVWMIARLSENSATRRAKAQHVILVLILVFTHYWPLFTVVQSVRILRNDGVGALREVFCIDKGVFPAPFATPLWELTVIAGVAVMMIIAGLARRRETARLAFRALIGPIYVVDAFAFYFQFQTGARARAIDTPVGFFLLQVVFAVLCGWIYIWAYRFYGSESSRPIFQA